MNSFVFRFSWNCCKCILWVKYDNFQCTCFYVSIKCAPNNHNECIFNFLMTLARCTVTIHSCSKRSLWKFICSINKSRVAHSERFPCKHTLYSPMMLNKRLKRTNKTASECENWKQLKLCKLYELFYLPHIHILPVTIIRHYCACRWIGDIFVSFFLA